MNDPEITDLLTKYRQARAPTIAEREQAWRGIEAQLAQGLPAQTATEAATRSTAATGSASAGTWTTLKVVGVLTLVGGPAAWWVASGNPGETPLREAPRQEASQPQTSAKAAHAEDEPATPAASMSPKEPSPATPAPAPGSAPAPTQGPHRTQPAAADPGAATVKAATERPRRPARRAAPPAARRREREDARPKTQAKAHDGRPQKAHADNSLAAELALIQQAHAQLRQGDPREALRTLDSHAMQFPQGELTPSRQVTRMLALCDLGLEAQARTLAARFLRESPDSPFAGRVRKMCPR